MRELKLGNDFMSMPMNNFIQQRPYFSILKALFHVSFFFFLCFWGGGERVVRGDVHSHAWHVKNVGCMNLSKKKDIVRNDCLL